MIRQTLVFNMQVKEGGGFNGIILEDEDLNVIEISKTIDGDTLTITPADPLTNNTQYTLTIPANAVGTTTDIPCQNLIL